MRRLACGWPILSLGLAAAACAGRAGGPVAIQMGVDACAHCRMVIVSQRTAAEIVAPGEEPRLFDDLGCLQAHLARAPLPSGAVVYVADHRTGAWVEARHAVFTKTSVSTPMGSGIVAHADAASRDADPDARGGTPAVLEPPR